MYITTVHLYSLIVAKERGLKQAGAVLRGKRMLLYVSVNIIWWLLWKNYSEEAEHAKKSSTFFKLIKKWCPSKSNIICI